MHASSESSMPTHLFMPEYSQEFFPTDLTPEEIELGFTVQTIQEAADEFSVDVKAAVVQLDASQRIVKALSSPDGGVEYYYQRTENLPPSKPFWSTRRTFPSIAGVRTALAGTPPSEDK